VNVGAEVAGPPKGTPVTVHPSRTFPDRDHYLGSAAFLPHVQGAFGEVLVMPAANLRVLPDALAPERAVLAEPLSVALHAVNRAGDVTAARVLVTGAGPIGALVVAVLRHRCAPRCWSVTSPTTVSPLPALQAQRRHCAPTGPTTGSTSNPSTSSSSAPEHPPGCARR
jgi:L-idonate 5-dehydrogenase